MKKIIRNLSVFLTIGIMGISLASCANKKEAQENKTSVNNEITSEKKEEESKTEITDNSKSDSNKDGSKVVDNKRIKLYFADENVIKLVEEEREIKDFSANTIVQELLKGPNTKGFNRTLHEDIKVKSVEVKDGIAYVDFDKNVKGKIAGSTGETMALYSISNSLILNKDLGVKGVEFTIEGEKVESLAGHIILDNPIKENTELIKK